jgi:acid phosphatase (class A)
MIAAMPKPALAAAVLAVLAVGGPEGPKPPGYLADSAAPDTLRILPPAPVAGTSRYQADRTVFLQTRTMKDSPRWNLAYADIDQGAILKDMACAVDVELTPANAPRLSALLKRIAPDVGRAVTRPKDFYGRKRPFLIDAGPICDARTPGLAASPDYPSGHSTWGWTVGLILAELAPDRATDILVRARAYGESRIICGVHNLSAVEAGRTNASALVAALHGSPEFRADLDGARREVAAARKAGPAPAPAACAAEAELVEKSPY